MLLLAGACAGPAEPAPPAPKLHATAEQWRTDEVARNLAVALHNDDTVPLRVTRVQLVLPSFTGAGVVDKEALLPVGGLRVDVPVPYGTGTACAGESPAAAPSQAIVDVAREGGPTRRVTLDLPHPSERLDRLLRQDCLAARAARSVALTFGPWTSTPDGALRGSLVVTRASGAGPDPVTVAELGGNVLYTLRPDRLGDLAAGAPTVAFGLRADALDCDPHAVAEVKKPYEFPVRLVLGGEDVPTQVTVTENDKLTLDTMLRARCGLPPRGK
ncbi:hypothetical protein Sya03_25430 [Spirilliplanes yamanashiensis]|uniref:Uncharacterized protein n=1 Tax=Spirilliplanes yamanashiensis TaxID=42233 RepID=A0A8J4DIX2_9ACTN|nr:hypothetical protein Sya03_25430 [Spirilliplanes yamanashiensis]